MKKEMPELTKSERDVMEILWKQKEAVTSSEIVDASDGKTWKPSYIHLLINSLLKKNALEVVGMKQTKKNYARTFGPTFSKEEYDRETFEKERKTFFKALPEFFPFFAQKESDEEIIEALSQMLEEKKKELEEKKEMEKKNS